MIFQDSKFDLFGELRDCCKAVYIKYMRPLPSKCTHCYHLVKPWYGDPPNPVKCLVCGATRSAVVRSRTTKPVSIL